jgi:lipopolysaccharide transport system ATP-binding protein
MSEVVIEVENLSKLYKLGSISSGSLRQDIHYWWNRMILKKTHLVFEDHLETKNNSQQFIWALKDVDFKVRQGETLGIIGKNGSGKSTLLKIISRIVQPTRGAVRGKGKVSSILEVGTGFHHELTGRENIYISGYILGMNKDEVRRKFDEIVAFSGIEKFIDTPVKRYSSGMYVRLAFSVAAHLEPDILIVDEVLAVGDAEFQKKCMGKMRSVSSTDGRTILFVSHNMQAINNLCSRALWLNNGHIEQTGKPQNVISSYIGSVQSNTNKYEWNDISAAPGNEMIKMKSIKVTPAPPAGSSYITVRTPVQLECEFWCLQDHFNININVRLLTVNGECVFDLGSPTINAAKAVLVLNSIIPGDLLNNATYFVSLAVIKNNSVPLWEFSESVSFDVEDVREGMHYFGTWPGIIRPKIDSTFYIKELLSDS